MSSPCTGCCFYDHEKDHCTACFRTLEEIGEWERMTEAEKHDVVKRCRIKRTYRKEEELGGHPAG